ncbi:MAG: hypothetical protein NW218_09365 [Saprospiraceae bacterium]|nr:hypothetical protein [Saprospiraceae bacterium]
MLIAAFLTFAKIASGQDKDAIATIDFVKIENGKFAEALFFYEHNWKVYRDVALERGYIKGYSVLSVNNDATSNYNLMLITEYEDSSQYNQNEKRFQQIIQTIRPDGPKLLNDLSPDEFRKKVLFQKTEIWFKSQE